MQERINRITLTSSKSESTPTPQLYGRVNLTMTVVILVNRDGDKGFPCQRPLEVLSNLFGEPFIRTKKKRRSDRDIICYQSPSGSLEPHHLQHIIGKRPQKMAVSLFQFNFERQSLSFPSSSNESTYLPLVPYLKFVYLPQRHHD